MGTSGSVSKLLGILGGLFAGLGSALLLVTATEATAAFLAWRLVLPIFILLLGLSLIGLSLVAPFRSRKRPTKDLPSEDLQDDPNSLASAPPPLVHLWITGRAKRPTLDLAALGPPIKVESGISLSQALEELRAED